MVTIPAGSAAGNLPRGNPGGIQQHLKGLGLSVPKVISGWWFPIKNGDLEDIDHWLVV